MGILKKLFGWKTKLESLEEQLVAFEKKHNCKFNYAIRGLDYKCACGETFFLSHDALTYEQATCGVCQKLVTISTEEWLQIFKIKQKYSEVYFRSSKNLIRGSKNRFADELDLVSDKEIAEGLQALKAFNKIGGRTNEIICNKILHKN